MSLMNMIRYEKIEELKERLKSSTLTDTEVKEIKSELKEILDMCKDSNRVGML